MGENAISVEFNESSINLVKKFSEDHKNIAGVFNNAVEELNQTKAIVKKMKGDITLENWYTERLTTYQRNSNGLIHEFMQYLDEDAKLYHEKKAHYDRIEGVSTARQQYEESKLRRIDEERGANNLRSSEIVTFDLSEEHQPFIRKYDTELTKVFEKQSKRKWLYFWMPLVIVLAIVVLIKVISMVGSSDNTVLATVGDVEINEGQVNFVVNQIKDYISSSDAVKVGVKAAPAIAGPVLALFGFIAFLFLLIATYVYYKICKMLANSWAMKKSQSLLSKLVVEFKPLLKQSTVKFEDILTHLASKKINDVSR